MRYLPKTWLLNTFRLWSLWNDEYYWLSLTYNWLSVIEMPSEVIGSFSLLEDGNWKDWNWKMEIVQDEEGKTLVIYFILLLSKNELNEVHPKELIRANLLKNWHNRSEKETECLDESTKIWKKFSIALINISFQYHNKWRKMLLIYFLINMIIGPKVSQNSLILGNYFFFGSIFLHVRCVLS